VKYGLPSGDINISANHVADACLSEGQFARWVGIKHAEVPEMLRGNSKICDVRSWTKFGTPIADIVSYLSLLSCTAYKLGSWSALA
jgi:hypothetical protein